MGDIIMDNEIVIKTDDRKRNKSNNKNNNNNTGIVLVVSILLSFVCGMMGSYIITKNVSVENVVKHITTSELVENSISTSVDKVYDSAVVVLAYSNNKLVSTGTGFIYKKIGKKGYIMTNNHVVDDADSVKIVFNRDDTKIDAKIVGGDKYADIAVLTIDDADTYQPVLIGDTEQIKLGDTVFTVGTPMGIEYKGTVTKGIISGKNRMVAVNVSGNTNDYYMKVLQIDAAVNPGNSGGPLCDVSGNVIGIISLKIAQNEVEGMGFAILIEDALRYGEMIEKGGQIQRPYVGISMIDLTDEYTLWKNRVVVPDNVDEGIAIVEVSKGSPADKSGLKKGDIIVSLGGKNVSTLADFRYELYQYQVGDKVIFTLFRDGKKMDVTVILGKSE